MARAKIQDLYDRMLLALRKRLDETEGVFMKTSAIVIAAMERGNLRASEKAALAKRENELREILADVLQGLSRLCRDRIEMFPVAPGDGFLVRMEKRSRQAEEFSRILDGLLQSTGDSRKQIGKPTQQWRSVMGNVDFKSEFERKFNEAAASCKRPNVLVAGYTGCGKTSLIRTVLGDAVVSAEKIDASRPCRIDFDCYENDSVRLWDSRGLELGEKENEFKDKMREFVSDCQNDPDVDEHIHLVWYLIQGNGARVTDCDLALMKEIFTFDDVIAVISKMDITKGAQRDAIRQVLIDAGVPEHRIVEVSSRDAQNCRELVELSCKMLPDAYRDAFMAAQSIDRDAKVARTMDKKTSAQEIVAQTAAEAKTLFSGKGAPETEKWLAAPAESNVTLASLLAGMLAKLASLYGLHGNGVRDEAARFLDALQNEDRAGFFRGGDAAAEAAFLVGAVGHFMRRNFEAYACALIQGGALPPLGFDVELFKNYFSNYKEGMAMKPNILVCGKTGVGKTSLIQAVTHRGVVPDSAIGNGRPATSGFQLYETEIADFIDSEGMDPGKQSVDEYADFILGEVLGRLDTNETDRIIHNIWYCIDGSGARIQDADAEIIKTLSDKVLLVVTKSELMLQEQIESMMKSLLELIPRERIVMVSADNKTGLTQLIAKAREMSAQSMDAAEEEIEAFQARWEEYYANMRALWQEGVSDEADSYVNWAAGRAAAIALLPIPLVDVAPLVANEIYMIYKLAGVYGIAVDGTIVTMLLGCAGGSLLGKIGASFLPGLKVPIAAAVTYGVGKAAKAYFESDMTLDEDELKEQFLAGEREAKKRDWKNAAEN
ncbi:MAG: hypothetical protein MJ016_03245 [Victivallaceae bacterium]|nr:hypothetical protein [Victivallaceae bacterium]